MNVTEIDSCTTNHLELKSLYEIAANVVSEHVTFSQIEALSVPLAILQNIKACKAKENVKDQRCRMFTIFESIEIIIATFQKQLRPISSVESFCKYLGENDAEIEKHDMFTTFTTSYREIALAAATNAMSEFTSAI